MRPGSGQVEIERRRDAGRIVVGRIEQPYRLFQIDPNNQVTTLPDQTGHILHQVHRVVRIEVADARAREEGDLVRRGIIDRYPEGIAGVQRAVFRKGIDRQGTGGVQ